MLEQKKLVGIHAILAAQKAEKEKSLEKTNQPIFNNPLEVPERIAIIADNSISMHNIAQEMRDGIVEFMRYCEFNKTSIAIFPMNEWEDSLKLSAPTTNLPAISILVQKIEIQGSTPMAATLERAIKLNFATRYILFSDGDPNTGTEDKIRTIAKNCMENRTPIDTVYISNSSSEDKASLFMQEIAKLSGGIYLKYQKGGVFNFGTVLAKLSPPQRLMLSGGK